MTEIRALAATGMLGTGFSEASLDRAMEARPHFIGCDAGSSDPGPYCLGSGRVQASRAATKRDLRLMLLAGRAARIPVIVGSAGTAGGDPHLAFTRDVVPIGGRSAKDFVQLVTSAFGLPATRRQRRCHP
jgi:hypothetical protein